MGINLDRKEMARQAFSECSSTTVRRGIKGKQPFWNTESMQFMFVPAFRFSAIRGVTRYRFTAVDEQGGVHTFEANDPCALLTPVWAELPEGVVKLTVTALNDDGSDYAPVGARTFFRLAPFPEDTPPAVCSYKECAQKAYHYAMEQGFVRYWLTHGVPDPCYDLNIYPSKMYSSLAETMISYASACPDEAEDAMKIAVNAADYMIRITPRGDAPLANLPPTYHFDFCPEPEKCGVITPNWRLGQERKDSLMMIYPASAGSMYLHMEQATCDGKYLEEAVRIGQFYFDHIEENGSWYLVRSIKTGKPTTGNFVSPIGNVIPFLMELFTRTQDEKWKSLADKAMEYVFRTQLATYNWEGQFEDTPVFTDYYNLTHFAAEKLAAYLVKYRRDDPQSVEIAKELMRFVEDQFVVWRRPNPWVSANENWHTPAGLEQYNWYVPIDGSTSTIAHAFLEMYRAGLGDLYLAKARALTDQLTRVQHENGQIPTHWMNTKAAEDNFWFNCMFGSCRLLTEMAEFEE